MRTSREVKLTTAGRTLLGDAPLALAALEEAAEHTRLAGAGVTGTVRLGYAPAAGFETLGAILAGVENDHPNMTVIASELFSAEIPGRVLAGEIDVGLALHPEPRTGMRTEVLRIEPLAALIGKRHRFANSASISIADLEHETLLLFPRDSLLPTTTALWKPASKPGVLHRGSVHFATRLSRPCSRAYLGLTRLVS